MAILGEIRRRPALLMGIIALALLAFLVNPDSIDKVFGKSPDVLGKVNGEKITREEFNDQLQLLQQQSQQQGQPATGLEEQAWQILVQSKLIKQEFDKLGLELTDDMFWNQLQYDPMFAQNTQLFDDKGNFKIQDVKSEIEKLQTSGNTEAYNNWIRMKKSIEYRIMARQLFANISSGITTSKKEAETLMKFRDQLATIDFVKVDYSSYLLKNPIKVTTQDLADYIKKHQVSFKTQPSRNLGVVYFPATPSAADDAKAKADIEKLLNVGSETSTTENFRNTTNDSMFVSLNSDMPFNSGYFGANQLPQTIQPQVANAAVGTIWGPYKEQNFYVVSKLVGKKPSDSTLARHILISYKGNQAGGDATRTKEAAKKLADSVGTILKADPAKFAQYLNLSSDVNSAAQGGALGWSVSTQPQFVPEFQKFVDVSPKGATGVVETQFGYHIINIQDKKSGTLTYKIANLVKTVKPSDATENEIDKNSRRFIQQVQGKSFNEFSNIAKKANYQFFNAKSAKRFEGKIQNLGTDKDEEILTWAFDKKRETGDTEMFTVDGTGDKIVVFLNGIYDESLADPESVREQLEPLVKNQLAAKKISEKIKASNITSLDQAAKVFGTAKQNAQVNMVSPLIAGAMEPKVAGAAFGVAKGKVSNPVEGMTGVFLLVKTGESVNKQPGDAKQVAQSLTQQNSQMFGQMLLKSLQENADIEDYRIEVWNKVKAN